MRPVWTSITHTEFMEDLNVYTCYYPIKLLTFVLLMKVLVQSSKKLFFPKLNSFCWNNKFPLLLSTEKKLFCEKSQNLGHRNHSKYQDKPLNTLYNSQV